MMTAKQWTVNEIRDTMTASGSHWWEKSAMKFFGTRVLPTVYQGRGGIYFVTSEQPPHGARGFTVRRYDAQANKIDTMNADLASMTRSEAKAFAIQLAGDAANEIVEPLAGQDAAPVSHLDLIANMLGKCDQSADDWRKRHAKAWRKGYHGGFDTAAGVVQMIHAIATYADAHRKRFESGIGEDGFLGDYWAGMIKNVRALLNGETGGLDCGLLDALLIDMLKAEDLADDLA